MSGIFLAVPDGSSSTARTPGESATRQRSNSQLSAASQQENNDNTEVDFSRQPTIRIQRQSSRQNVRTERSDVGYFSQTPGRKRSSSDPVRRDFANLETTMTAPRPGRQDTYMPNIAESSATPGLDPDASQPAGESSNAPALRRAGTNIAKQNEDDYENQLVDFLDLVDPEVSTLTTLTNVQNSLFVPDLGRYLNRRPTYVLTRRETKASMSAPAAEADDKQTGEVAQRFQTAPERPQPDRTTTTATLNTISSRVNERYFAVLPHGVRLTGWTEEDKLELNDHVRHMLHSRRSKFKRSMKGFGQYVKKPLGFFVTLYATLITLFGMAWVIFLIGWIYVDGRQAYVVHIIDSVLVALFAVVGDGLAPFRVVDTYHMCFIAHYHHLTWRLRREKALPELHNRSDLPPLQPNTSTFDPEKQEYSVLSREQQKKLEHHQKKFSKSHSFYKPHETTTHQAFSLPLLVAIVVLLDCHSLLQISLGACTWGINYHIRPFAVTTVILCCSITCNITAGVLISIGDKRSRKKDVIEKMFRQQLTEEAIEKVEHKRQKELEMDLNKKGLGSELQLRQDISSGGMADIDAIEIEGEGEKKKDLAI